MLRPASVRGWHSTSSGLPASIESSFVGSSAMERAQAFCVHGVDVDAVARAFPFYVRM